MGYQLSREQFDRFLDRLQDDYRVFGPALDSDKGAFSDTDRITYKNIRRLDDLELNRKSYFSPKEIFFPIRETLFRFCEGEPTVPQIDDKKIAILLRPCDSNAIDRLDAIFLENGPFEDFYYKRRRENVRFFLIECATGFDSCWCVSMNANTTKRWDVAFRFGEDEILVDVKSEEFLPYLDDCPQKPFEIRFIYENTKKVRVPEVGEVTLDHFAHELWNEYTARCIACGRCNTSCPTCSCFTVLDAPLGAEKKMGERWRAWAGCHIDGFTDMAGGHTFRQSRGERMRFKTMHKINDYRKRFGKHQCVGCGRCDDVCPQYISFARCINTLSDCIEEGKRK
ncbi:MAG: anaerobic sulfite reductase subunit AsrA [Syntrophobacteraceae bacterium]|nr:anaerobic sulfite reductase subunit AsrA [Syntrophobacteraceae bacterium]